VLCASLIGSDARRVKDRKGEELPRKGLHCLCVNFLVILSHRKPTDVLCACRSAGAGRLLSTTHSSDSIVHGSVRQILS